MASFPISLNCVLSPNRPMAREPAAPPLVFSAFALSFACYLFRSCRPLSPLRL
jgi:hypothetical protein